MQLILIKLIIAIFAELSIYFHLHFFDRPSFKTTE